MPFQVSPGVNVSEIDLTTVIPAVSTTEGAIAGIFKWGPVNQRILIDSENELVSRFGEPDSTNFETFFTAANFLAYGNKLYVTRAADTALTFNAIANTAALAGTVASQAVKNLDDYNAKTFDANTLFVAKYPGTLGNSLKVSVCTTNNAFSQNVYAAAANASITTSSMSVTVNPGTNTALFSFLPNLAQAQAFANLFTAGDILRIGNASIGFQDLKINVTNSSNNVPVAIANVDANAAIVGNSTTGNTYLALSSAGSYSLDEPVRYLVATGNTAISPLVSNTVYYIRYQNSSHISLGSVPGGAAITLSKGLTQTGHSFTGETYGRANLQFTQNYQLSTNVIINSSISFATANIKLDRNWEFYNNVTRAPGTSAYANTRGGAGDEIHIVVVDEDGDITGSKGAILEVYEELSRATDAVDETGKSIYFRNVIADNSGYIWTTPTTTTTGLASAMATTGATKPVTLSLAGGASGESESNASISALSTAYDQYKSAEDVDVSLILAGKARGGTANTQLANYIIDNICETRKDCVVFISPERGYVVANGSISDISANIVTFRNALNNSSYAFLDSGYKYAYDKYSDVYRYVPLNGDIAGLAVRTDTVRDPWFSPAGFNRGIIKNTIKLAYNPGKADRDILYKSDINPVVTFPGQGTLLFGDKTLLGKPSAFDRINVRRLFIVLEKAIATAAKFTLFEFNDTFTRAQFRNLVEPFLRDVLGRRGIYDYRVVCDETNNTPEVIDRNEFIGDIYIKPARSINFIQLNFVAVRTGVEFSEIVGQF